jgi:DNA-binding transcriptional LysR family regulator
MRLSQPTASRIIALLEEQLGATLFSRSTRALTLTDAGAAYLARVQPILESLEEADNAIRGSNDLRGVLRIAVASIIASRAIVPRLGAFVAQHPDLQVELMIDDRRQDLIQEGIDVAIRFGKLPDSSAIARLIGRWPLPKGARRTIPPPDSWTESRPLGWAEPGYANSPWQRLAGPAPPFLSWTAPNSRYARMDTSC